MQTDAQSDLEANSETLVISDQEMAASQEIDNMSISEIIQQRFKKQMKVQEVKTAQQVADLIIKPPQDANLV